MKTYRIVVCFLVLSAIFTPDASSAESIDIPKVSIIFGGLLERACGHSTDTAPSEEAITEVQEREDEFIKAWEAFGPALLKETVNITGVPFSFSERVAVLHICPEFTSMSAPLLVKVNPYLNTLNPEDTWPLTRFVRNFLFHELLHGYLAGSFDDEILSDFEGLPPVTKYHVHLMAIEYEVFSRLSLTDEMNFSAGFYSSKPPYKAAMDLVTEKGSGYFIDQLKRHKKQ